MPTESCDAGRYLYQSDRRNGSVVSGAAVQVDDCDQIMMITDAGTLGAYPKVSDQRSWDVIPGALSYPHGGNENVVGLQRVAEPVDDRRTRRYRRQRGGRG